MGAWGAGVLYLRRGLSKVTEESCSTAVVVKASSVREALNNSIPEFSEHIPVPQEPLNKSEVP